LHPARLQQLGDGGLLAFERPTQRGGMELAVAQMEVGAALDEEFNHLLMAVDRSPVESGSPEEAAAVDIGSFFQKKLRYVDMSVAAGDVEGIGDQCAVVFRRRRFDPLSVAEIAGARLSSVGLERGGRLPEGPHHVEHAESRGAPHVELRTRAVRQQHLRHIAAAHVGGPLKRRHAPGDLGVDVGALGDQQLRKLPIVLLGGPVQRRLVVRALGIHQRGIGLQEPAYFGHVSALRSFEHFLGRRHDREFYSGRQAQAPSLYGKTKKVWAGSEESEFGSGTSKLVPCYLFSVDEPLPGTANISMKATFFKSGDEFRGWLEKNHNKQHELLLGFYKKVSGKGGITYPEALDEALAFGWIDGVRKSLDDASYTIRFTPRKPKSIWSMVNIKRVGELTKLGRMRPPGLAAFEGRDLKRAQLYSYERKTSKLGPDLEKKFRANKKAWEFFQAQPPGYQHVISWYVISAKQEETRLRRLERLIKDSENGRRVGILERKKK
jgi:uncharacterized protein YdeI (YjbR/CyaY-like superfamily)